MECWPALRLWEAGKVTWSELDHLSLDDVLAMNEVADAAARSRATEFQPGAGGRKR